MPRNLTSAVVVSLQESLLGGEHLASSGDLLNSGTALLVGVLTAAAAIGVAWRQNVLVRRHRAEDRAERLRLQQVEQEKAARREQRQAWECEYNAITNVLDLVEDAVYSLRDEGPLDEAALRELGLNRLAIKAEQLACRVTAIPIGTQLLSPTDESSLNHVDITVHARLPSYSPGHDRDDRQLMYKAEQSDRTGRGETVSNE